MVLKCKNMYVTIVSMICTPNMLIIVFKSLIIVIIVILKFAIFWKNRIWLFVTRLQIILLVYVISSSWTSLTVLLMVEMMTWMYWPMSHWQYKS